jgi:hypothetical protein
MDAEPTLERRLLGVVEVDSGTLLVGDPAYLLPRAEDGTPGIDYASVIGAGDEPASYVDGKPVILLGSFGGDGTFPVFGEIDEYGQLARITIEFVGPDDAEDEEGPAAEDEHRRQAAIEATLLRTADQLPPLALSGPTQFVWDREVAGDQDWIVIRAGPEVKPVWRERASAEGFSRFVDARRILRERYRTDFGGLGVTTAAAAWLAEDAPDALERLGDPPLVEPDGSEDAAAAASHAGVLLNIRIRDAHRHAWDDPSVPLLSRLVGGVAPNDDFVILERLDVAGGDGFAQSLHQADGTWIVEYRDTSLGTQYQARTHDSALVVRVLLGWARRGDGWREGLDWTPLHLAPGKVVEPRSGPGDPQPNSARDGGHQAPHRVAKHRRGNEPPTTEPSGEAQLRGIASFLPAFEVPGFEFGTWGGGESRDGIMTMPYFSPGETASAFVRAVYDLGWVRPDFDWPTWMRTDEAVGLRDQPDVLARATPDQLARLLTVLIRQDRFVEGGLAASFSDGLLTAILRRAGALLAGDGKPDEGQND